MVRTRNTDRPSSVRRWILLTAVGVLGVTGYFGPWIPYRAAGLTITGLDLGEYVKFLPQVSAGQIPIQREAFYAPLVAASLIATLLSSRRQTGRLRWLLLLAAILLALAQLPPAWSPSTLRMPEFRSQTVAIVLCLATIPLVALIRHLPDRLILAGISLPALIAALWPAWSFLQVRPAIAAVYNEPLPLGWGFWACTSGYLGLTFLSTALILSRREP